MHNFTTEQLIALTLLPGVGPVMQRRLVRHFGDFESIVRAGPGRLARLSGLEADRFRILQDHQWQQLVDTELQFCVRHKILVVTLNDPVYPGDLAECHDAPLVLYCLGSMDWAQAPGIALVGTREATETGKRTAHRISGELAAEGFAIISGLARGIDLAAHQGCMDAGGSTIAVLGHGLRLIYPARHRPVAAAIVELGGCLMTEFIHSTPFNPGNFPSRNRLIAGLSKATVVVEARKTGGALITAQLANGYQREVFAVPGPADSPYSEGCHDLIRTHTAQLITCGAHIFEHLPPQPFRQISLLEKTPQTQPLSELTSEEVALLQHLGEQGIHADELLELSGFETHALMATLLFLEMKGVIEALPGKYYRRR